MTQFRARIALVEDDVQLARWISEYLGDNGMQVETAARGDEAVELIRQMQPDLVLLDLMLPGMDGHQVCREIRPFFSNPVIVLTANDAEIDEVLSLEMGADDFIAKPVRPRALLARLNTQLRRLQERAQPEAVATLTFGALSIDRQSRRVSIEKQDIAVSDAEFDLLWLLAASAGDVISRQALVRQLRGLDYDGFDRAIDVRVSRLRKKLGDTGDVATKIKTIWGKGYLFVPDCW